MLALSDVKTHFGSANRCEASASAPHATPRFQLLGEVRWDVEARYGGVLVGGLSSVEFDAQRDEYLLISDDRSVHGPARFYTARMHYDASGMHSVWLTGMHALWSPAQRPYSNQQSAQPGTAIPDPEALRLTPSGQSLLWTSEGDFRRGFGPELNESTRTGRWLRQWTLPAMLQKSTDSTGPHHGPRSAFTLEGMTFSDDGRILWISMEGALHQDGPMPSPGRAGAPVRITALDAASGAPVRQFAYPVDALPDTLTLLPDRAVNGVSDILADGPDHLLVLERSFSLEQGWGARLYRVSLGADAASDTLLMERLLPGEYRTVEKQLVLDFAHIGLRSVDNIEGMTWGAPLTTGERVLVLVSDNNFNPAEVTQFIALVENPGCPSE